MTSELKTSEQALPQGFQWGAVKAGIKASGNLDVAVAVADKAASAAAMFTKNQVVAAPVTVGRRHLHLDRRPREDSAGQCRQRKLRYRTTGNRRLPEDLRSRSRDVSLHLR